MEKKEYLKLVKSLETKPKKITHSILAFISGGLIGSIGEVIRLDENSPEILMRFGMGCIGCPSAQVETIEQACEIHGLNLDEVLKALNEK